MYFAITISAIWLFSAIAGSISKDSQWAGAAMITTIIIGIGYLFYKT